MKIHIRFEPQAGSNHQSLAVFVNGGNTGFLTMSPAEAVWFNHILQSGCAALSPAGSKPIEFVASGQGPDACPVAIDETVKQ